MDFDVDQNKAELSLLRHETYKNVTDMWKSTAQNDTHHNNGVKLESFWLKGLPKLR